ncbi:MAG TPA: non-ribosomal peptide synthase/polyketide synthase [Thermoanaerobaculia bacterium]|jgi:amino acid adenylation domain-containing protein|nr:non-ribosomal peptide synthase/polyketide synthase [Thermoanaerobaculia bacterium]
MSERNGLEIAIVGLAGRFPGARDLRELWANLRDGVESIRRFSDEELVAAGVPREVLADPRYVKAGTVIEGADLLDAEFFSLTPREAEIIDPQHRLFLECAWEALEAAGYDSESYRRPIGVYAGVSFSTYVLLNVWSNRDRIAFLGSLLGADKDHLATLVSYKLDLEGPSLAIQTACSTSLVAVHLAAQGLLNGECDMALAGGVSVRFPQSSGYFWSEGGITSPDGHCRAFDAGAEGTVFGDGLGIVVLKRLADAEADGDTIHAVIKGSAINNDGAAKVGYTAPRMEGQTKVIRAAQIMAEVEPDSIGYVEAHGTGTALGDPIEVAALTEAFRAGGTGRTGFCALGSVKPNLGHLNAASGIAGLIKTVLVLKHRTIPPTLHFERPNPEIDFAGSPFVVSAEAREWPAGAGPRRAGVSSFGMGGTNAHLIVEEAPPAEPTGPSRTFQMLVLSARSAAALEAATDRLAGHLEEHPEEPLADIAYTLHRGRRGFGHRRLVLAGSREEAVGALASRDPQRVLTAAGGDRERPVCFLFPGQGAQHVDMARGLYETETVFRQEVDRCAERLTPRLGFDLRRVLFPGAEGAAAAAERLGQTAVTQPALFVVEYALARLWMAWGIQPRGMLGHSVGEYVAACLAGVFTLEEALDLVALRGRLVQELPGGAMLAVPLPADRLEPLLGERVALAAVNGPALCVVSGGVEDVEQLRRRVEPLLAEGLECRPLRTSHAFHSAALDPILGAFAEALRSIPLKAPSLPFVSNLTGQWITAAEATDPGYWVRHLRHTVRFADGLATLAALGGVLLEVGPGRTLGTLARQHPDLAGRPPVASLRHPQDREPDQETALRGLGQLWLAGARPDWRGFYAGENRRRIPLPTYPFERRRYWIEPKPEAAAPALQPAEPAPAGGEAAEPAERPQELHPRPSLGTSFVAPSSGGEQAIAAVWRELFGIAEIGIHDDFYDLGGHSLLVTQMASRVRDTLGLELPLRVFFEERTVARLAAFVERQSVEPPVEGATSGEAPPLERRTGSGDLPLSFGQQRLWFLDRLDPESSAYNISAAVRLLGRLDLRVLAATLDEVVRRHEVLRTTFAAAGHEPVQVIHPPSPFALAFADLSGLPMVVRDIEAQERTLAELRQPFDLARGPLTRATLVRMGQEEHILLFSMHHIVSDGWSMGVLVREVGALYPAFAAGQRSPLPELPVQYADYAAWQRSWLQGAALTEQVDYWRERLAGAPALLRLPTDRPRPAMQRFQGARIDVLLPREATEAVQRAGQQQGITLFMTLLAAFAVLLQRHSGEDDVVVGSPSANRNRAELESLIGFFVNTLVLRVGLAGDPAVDDLLARVRDVALGAYAHQSLPFEKLVEELRPDRSLSHSPLFQVMLVLQNAPAGDLSLPGLTLRPEERPHEISKFDLTLTLNETGLGLLFQWRYNTELFDEATVARQASHLENLIAALAANPRQRISELPLLGEAERRQLVMEWGRGAATRTASRCLHELVEEQAARRPDAVALAWEDGELSYAELDRQANRLARRLRRLGVGPEVLVGLCTDRSPGMVLGLLAVLKAGGAYVPFDPAYPAERLAWLLKDSGVAVLLTQERLAAGLPPHAATMVLLEQEPEESRDALPPLACPENLAYMIYTSGSTGLPKGVLVSHRGLDNLAQAQSRLFEVGPESRVLQFASLSFDASVSEVAMAFRAGAALVLAPRQSLVGPELSDLLREQRITTVTLPPTALATLPEAGLPALRTLVVAGEACPIDLARRWAAGRRLVNAYGPTETTVCATSWVYDGGDRLLVGRPIQNLEAYVLDAAGSLAPTGVPGELLVGGIGLARGYRGRPDLTAERFVPHPFAAAPGERLYRTGDLVRFVAAGDLEFLGRIDHQVKIRGVRVEVGEVEAALLAQPGVRAAVAVARQDGSGPARLVAYAVPVEDSQPEGAALRAALAATLPEALVPSAVVVLPALPLTPSGKVDRKALPAPEGEGAAKDAVAPRTELERFLAGLWQEMLGVGRVGVHDNFFGLGGNSILGAMFVNRLQQELGEIVHVVVMFDAPTVAELATYLAEHYAEAVAKLFGTEAGARRTQVALGRIDDGRVASFRALIPPARTAEEAAVRNPPAAFILSPPRSGSTLLRVMLAGNPNLFAPPELELLSFRTLAERREAFPGRNSFWLEGATRGVMEIRRCSAEEAEALLAELEGRGATTRELYRLMQEWIGDRLLVDKTPSYALDLAVLRRAEEAFADARYVHLLRHPYGMIRSFEEAKLEQVFFRHPHSLPRRELAELIWLVSQQNILQFLAEVPADRQLRVRFEELVAEPERELRRICEFLGLEYDPGMALPYEKKAERMTDGIHAWSRMLGDVKFHQHSAVDASVAERWRQEYDQDFLGDPTWGLAAGLGYERPITLQRIPRRAQPAAPVPLSFAQERLWFLDQLEPGSATYNIRTAVRLTGELDAAALRQAIAGVVGRHESLRTVFSTAERGPLQRVLPTVRWVQPLLDLSSLPEDRREPAARRIVEEESGLPFDLAQGPLMRAALLRLGAREHVSVLTIHHIVGDGWSMGVLVRELVALYAAAVEGRPAPLPELPIQYPDFAVWQRDWLRGEALEAQVSYWRRHLDAVPALELPTDRPRPAVQTFHGARCGASLSAALSAALGSLASRHGSSLFMVLLTAFKLLMSRLSGQADLAVGSPIAGRNRPEVEGLIGFFLNSLALRTDLAGDPTFGELLGRVRQTVLEAFTHQDVPFEKLLEELRPERSLSRTPLFQVFFNMLNLPEAKAELPGLTLEPFGLPAGDAKFDLTLYVSNSERGIDLTLTYNSDLFLADRMEELLRQYQALLAQVAERPADRIGSFSLVTAEAAVRLPDPAARLGDTWQGTVHRLFQRQAALHPERPAVLGPSEVWSYGELEAASDRLAFHLQTAAGVEPGDRVAIYAHRSAPLAAAVLGVLKAGAAFVMLDPAYPAARLLDTLRLAEPRALLRLAAAGEPAPELAAWAEGLTTVILPPGGPEATLAILPAGAPIAVEQGPEDLAYVAFTSGSTGLPKGILGRHGPLSHFLPWQCARFGLTEGDRFSMLSGLSHDPLQRDLFTPLFLGAAICVPDPDEVAPVRLAAWMAREGVSVAHLTPAMGQLLTEGAREGLSVPSLRYVLLVGDVLTRLDVARLRQLAPAVTCVNFYGSTETQRAVAYHEVAEAEIAEGERGRQILPLGRGMEDVQLVVLTAANRLAGVGEVGEICVRSPHLAAGYLGDPAQTAERFVLNPFTGVAADRLYRTGDLGRYLPDGEVEFVSRADHQVKIRGFRIELGEIEAQLGRHPGVAEAVVVARESEGLGKRLVAYVVPESGRTMAVEALREALKERLPAYMVPAAFVLLAALPITPNGKVDRRALPEPAATPTSGDIFAGPRTPVEELLAGIWCEVLKRERVGIHESFFDLGGHSLLATQVVSRIREAFAVEIPLRWLFERPTIASLGTALGQATAGELGAAPPLRPTSRAGDLPLSFAQERLWFLDQLERGTPFYNLSGALRLSGDLQVEALAAALREVVRRHAALRTRFVSEAGRPVQRIEAAVAFDLPAIDLRGLSAAEREIQARRLASAHARRPFSLDNPPLLRASLLRLGEDEHILLYAMHHIVSDGWSMGVLIGEVARLYAACAAGEPSPFPELPIQYADFAVWQREWLRGEVLEEQVAYWRQRLAGAPVVELPADRPRQPMQSFRGALHRDGLPADSSGSVAALARRQGVSPFMVLLAAFQALVGRYSGLEDVVVGTPIANRTRVELEGLIGFFVNTLVLRAFPAGELTVAGLLRQVREAALGAYAHQDLPFEVLVEKLQPQRDLSRNPLFQLMFNLLNMPAGEITTGGLSLAPLEAPGNAAQFDLQVYVREMPSGFAMGWEYATDLYDEATVERLARHFGNLLAGMVNRPEACLSELPLLDEAERAQLLVDWNATARPVPSGCVHEWIAAQAARTPEAVAVVFGSDLLTYGQLDRRANWLALWLKGRGVGPEVRVGIALERSLEMVVALLGVLKAGGSYVPLDPSYPVDRLAFMREDAGLAVVLADESLRELPEVASAPESLVGPDNGAYVIYTSGSTGRPKGVQISHGALANFLTSMAEEPGLTSEDRLLAVTSLSFDIAGLELYLPLMVGGRVVLAGREEAADGRRLQALIAESGATVLQATPATWRLLLETGWQGGEGLKALCGGEALSPALATALRQRVGSLWNVYGPTETTVWSTVEEITGDGPILIGRPIANTEVYVLDGAGQPAPVGVPGELLLGGVGVARGYLGRPELTAEKLVPNPFGIAGSRLYRTGDLARYRASGALECLGRIDHQVKVRGFRIELGEIEAVIGSHPDVATTVVVAREESSGDRRLVAYVVPRQAGADLAAELRAAVRQSLPEYMVPAAWIFLAELPLTPNGKVDRKALPAPVSEAAVAVAPRTPAEEVLAAIWEQVLSLETVGATDNFFDLGGHSLLATQVVSRVREAFGVELPLRRVFEVPTLEGLARTVEQLRSAHTGFEAPPIVRIPRDGELPLSFSQQRVWILDQLEVAGTAYHLGVAVRLRGELDAVALESAVSQVVRRHEALRTTFVSSHGRPLQVIAEPAGVPLPRVDLRALPAAAWEAEARRVTGEVARLHFDLVRGPLLRTVLVTREAGESLFGFTVHHIVADGWSLGILVREIAAFYRASRDESSQVLPPPLSVQYADFAAWQRSWLQGAVLDAQLSYWKVQLAALPPVLQLAFDRPRRTGRTTPAGRRRILVPEALGEALRNLGRRGRATPFMTLLAGFATLLCRYTGQGDIALGTPIANRERIELEGLIGFFANTLVLRTNLSGDPDFLALLARTRTMALDAYAHQDLPFERLVEELQPDRDLAVNPLFQIMFQMQNVPQASAELPGLSLQPMEAERGAAMFELVLSLRDAGRGFGGTLEYDADLFEATTIERLAGHWTALLAGVAERPDLPLSRLPLLSAAERHQASAEWSDSAAGYPRTLCLHEIIAAQAARAPEAVAVSFEGCRLTYGELEAQAGRLAATLAGLGAGPETLVGVCLERSPEMIAALLGVWKAGAAYVPMDPSYPEDRLVYMLEDAGISLLVAGDATPGLLRTSGARIVPIGGADGTGEGRPQREAGTENLAYAIYTSGSTGRPKGVEISHGALVNFMQSMSVQPGLARRDVLLAVTSLSFDIAALELFLPLMVGGQIELASREVAADGARLLALLRGSGATVMQATPVTWHLLIEAGWQGGDSLKVLCGGEALPERLAAELCRRSESVWNLYGPTETTVWSAVRRVRPEERVAVGPPVANTGLYLLDAGLHRVPLGISGELWIGGEGLARGYRARPELTAERFVPDPFAARPGARMYRSGDLGRFRPDGAIEILGRADFQVKVRGFRIELGEIEAALEAQPEVERAVVVASGEERSRRLVAYLVPRAAGASTLSVAELRERLGRSLPDYMLPAAWMLLESLPLTPNGKVDRRALPAPEGGRPDAGAMFVAPRTALEELLAGVWAEALQVERVGVDDNFFTLGGHSLLAMQVISRVREAFGVELPLRSLFERPTVAAMAAKVEVLRSAEWSLRVPPIRRVPREGELPLSFAQERLWFLDQLQPGSPAYNLPSVVRLRGALDLGTYRRSLIEIVRRHESLRTRFAFRGGIPIQVIEDTSRLEVPVVDLRALPAERRETDVRVLVAEELRRPFDLAAGPLLRALVLRTTTLDGEEELILLLLMHHIVSDGWSMTVLAREIGALYGAFLEGAPSPLPELPIQYADFAVWQRNWLQGAVLEEQISFWKQTLAGAATLELPTDRPRPPIQGHRGGTERFVLPARLLHGLGGLGKAEGVTLYMILLAGFSALLSRYSGQEDVSIGSPIANRTRAELEPLIGFFANTLVLRTSLAGGPSFLDLLVRIRAVTLAAYDHQDLPIEKVVEEINPQRDLSRSPLFQALLALQLQAATLDLPGLAVAPSFERGASAETMAKFDLSLWMQESAVGVNGSLEFQRDLFDPSTAARLAVHLRALLERGLEAPGRPLSELPLLTAAELQQVAEGNATATPFSAHLAAHQLFEAWVDRTPDAVAAVFAGQSLTYRELNRRANRLAHYLRRLGVGAEDRVAFCLERSADLLVALLAVMKSGGTYVPLDLRHPRERLAYVLSDTQAAVLLTGSRVVNQLEGLPPASAAVVLLDQEPAELAAASPENPEPLPASAERLAYIIYTSGSTGRPKGVQVPHRALVNFLESMARRPGFSAQDTLLAITTLSFDMAVPEVLLPLVTGARLVIAPAEAVGDGAMLAGLLASSQSTVLQATPTTWWLLMASGWQGTPGLRGWIGAEAVPREVADQLLDRGVDLWTFYGPTETTVWSTCTRVARTAGPVPLGEAFANTQIYVLDRALQPVPLGVPGELYIGGWGVTRGYFGQPGLTAERYLPDPFSAAPGARMYRTSDLVRRRPDSVLEFLGRADFQVKIRGFRIELGEIEAALQSHASVERAAVVAHGEEGARRLVAYLVPQGGDASGLSVTDLRESLGRSLPEYMIPSAWVLLDALPLTPNGKVDRRALPAPAGVRSDLGAVYVAPRTALEEVLAGIWCEVLRIERVGIQDNFFTLGGHSLLATQVVSRIGEDLQIEVPLRRLFEAPTICGLAEALLRDSSSPEDLELAARLVLDLLSLPEDEVDALLLRHAGAVEAMEERS